MTASEPVRILHLSDIHFRASKTWDADPVLRALTGFIGQEVEQGLMPDLVAMTGDLAFSGKADEYELAIAWLEDLWPKFGDLPRDRLLLVPGNHDVDRSKVGKSVRWTQDALLNARSQGDIAELLGNDDERATLLKRHDAYLAFLTEWFEEDRTIPWWERKISIRGTEVHVAGLDSAWMSCGDQDRGRLLLGRWQVHQTVLTPGTETAQWRIALVHHPWDFLADFEYEEIPASIQRHADLVLRGHRHKTDPQRLARPDSGQSCLELAAGCVYDGSDYPNAFQWIELSPPPEKEVRVRFRLWHEGAWIVDRNRTPGGYEWWAVDFERPEAIPSPASEPSRPTVPNEYREWLRRRHQKVDLLGVKEGCSLTLHSVYVPAVTIPKPDFERKIKGNQKFYDYMLPTIRKIQSYTFLLDLLNQGSFYMAGPAGAGKSTFCRWATLQTIADAEIEHPVPAPPGFSESSPYRLRGRLPIMITLRDFSLGMACGRGQQEWKRSDLEQALVAWIEGSPPDGLTGKLLKDHLDAGNTLLLFDGLDEVAVTDVRDGIMVYPRALLITGLIDALPVWREADNRVLLTSRPYGLDRDGVHRLGLPETGIEAMPVTLQDLFIRRWFTTLGKPEKIDQLVATINDRREELAPLVDNPLLLTAICVLHDNGGRLPEDRYALYKDVIGNVLSNRYPGDARVRDPVERRLEAIALGMHQGDDVIPRRTPAAEISCDEIERILARFADRNRAYETDGVEVAARREELLNRSGLLVPRPGERAAFYHLSIQEFLTAQRLARLYDDVEPEFRKWQGVPEWRQTLWFLFAARIAIRDAEWGLALLDRLIHDQSRVGVAANPAAAVLIGEALDLCLHNGYQLPTPLKQAFIRLALHAIEDEIDLKGRHKLGLTLGRLGDPRLFSLRDHEAYVSVPAGSYRSGEHKERRIEIQVPFEISRYPVTNFQYGEFISADGYVNKRWWSDSGWSWLKNKSCTEPEYWFEKSLSFPNQPVVGVSMWEAEACAYWAGGQLPTIFDWEVAARGPSALNYPWGDARENYICNTRDQSLGGPSAVGIFPSARQADFGIEDLLGNVFEWCKNSRAV